MSLSSPPLTPEDQAALAQAIALSRRHMQANDGGPFGAVIMRGGRVLSEGWNKVTSTLDPTAHAEVVAIRLACEAVGDYSLKGATLYSSCEPCPMCLAAAYWARLDRIVYANTRDDAAAIGFDDAFIYEELPKAPQARAMVMQHVPSHEAQSVFAEWDAKTDKQRY